jgi:hypothetical protein
MTSLKSLLTQTALEKFFICFYIRGKKFRDKEFEVATHLHKKDNSFIILNYAVSFASTKSACK